MSLLRCTDIRKSFGELQVLRGVELEINPEEKIALVGNNGTGKTTLANIIFGDLEADGGNVICYNPKLKVGYLRQATSYTINTFNEMVSNNASSSGDFLELASQMGLEKVARWDEERFAGLSGGERTKLALAHVWASQPNLLILDEPTNHMDFHGVEWLVEEVNKFSGACLIISHDRWFMDQVVTRTYELDRGKLTEYAGNYSFYQAEKKRQYQSQLHQYQDQQKEQRRIKEEINRLKQWSARAHRDSTKAADIRMGAKEFHRVKAKKRDKQIKSRIKMLEKMEQNGAERPQGESRPEFEFDAAAQRGKRIVEATGLGKAFDNRTLFSESSFLVLRGEKLGVIGPNGCGKTTLIRILLGQERQDSGDLWLSPSLKPGYLSQVVMDMDTNKNALEILGVRQREAVTRARTLLACMGFDAAMVQKPAGKLSLGERTRLKLASMILQQNDLLVLDEPTNHLDLHSREQLEETLLDYNGTILIVSHDRYLLERVCDKLLVFEDGSIRKVETGFKQYRQGAKGQHKTRQQDKLVIETRMAWLINEMGKYSPGEAEYTALDKEFQLLVQKKRELRTSGKE